MTPRKINRAFAIAGIPEMPQTRQHIIRNIAAGAPREVLVSMTSKQLAALMMAAHRSYHDGRASKGDIEIIDDAAWIGGSVSKLIPLAALRARLT